MPSESLWGELPLESVLRTPVSILQEQAAILTKATNGILEGRVTTANEKGKIKSTLRIIAPALGGYNLAVTSINHGIFLYPAESIDHLRNEYYEIDNEDMLIENLKDVLTSAPLHAAIAALVSQSRGVPVEDDNDLPF